MVELFIYSLVVLRAHIQERHYESTVPSYLGISLLENQEANVP